MTGKLDASSDGPREWRASVEGCEHQPIHAPGAIQPHGLLLAVDATSLQIQQASENVAGPFRGSAQQLLGRDLRSLFTEPSAAALVEALRGGIRERLTLALDDRWGAQHDAQLHLAAAPEGVLIVELEPLLAQESDCHPRLRASLEHLQGVRSTAQLWELAPRELRALTGFDSVLALLFHDDWSGQVVGEAKAESLPSLLGVHFPESEIPEPARRLYTRSWLRLVTDVAASPSPLVPQLHPAGQPLDLSFAHLRSLSPPHVAYLTRHGLTASLSVSLVVAGQLRGLLACRHHGGPLHVPRSVRDAAELLGQLISFQLRALEANEQAERALNERARRAEQAKDVFLANVSHELRTPLNAISGWTSMLQSGAVPSERIPHAIEVIARNARAQSQLVDDLIAVSGMSTGQLALHAQPLDLRDVVHGAMAAVCLSASAKLIRQQLQLEQGCWVLGDPCRLQQVTRLLLMNAVKFTPRGGELRVGLTRRAGEVELSVSDSGRGIAAEFLPRLFAPFRQQEEGPARSQQGLGLGLSMVRQLVELHGGRVEVDSAGPGKGAQFRVLLPALEPPQVAS